MSRPQGTDVLRALAERGRLVDPVAIRWSARS
jgi:hypothetical protein